MPGETVPTTGSAARARYMSPERAMGCARPDRPPDRHVFGLGGLALLPADRPRGAASGPPRASARSVNRTHKKEGEYVPVRQLNPRVPRSLERICHKALAADPERRYPTAVDPPGTCLEAISFDRRRIAAAGLIVLFLMAAVLFVPRPWPRPRIRTLRFPSALGRDACRGTQRTRLRRSKIATIPSSAATPARGLRRRRLPRRSSPSTTSLPSGAILWTRSAGSACSRGRFASTTPCE